MWNLDDLQNFEGIWYPTSGFHEDGSKENLENNVSNEDFNEIVGDIKEFAKDVNAIRYFKNLRQFWQDISKLYHSGDRIGILERFKTLIESDKHQNLYVAMARDFIEFTQLNKRNRLVFSLADFGFSPVSRLDFKLKYYLENAPLADLFFKPETISKAFANGQDQLLTQLIAWLMEPPIKFLKQTVLTRMKFLEILGSNANLPFATQLFLYWKNHIQNPQDLIDLLKVFNFPQSEVWRPYFIDIIRAANQRALPSVAQVFRRSHTEHWNDQYQMFIEFSDQYSAGLAKKYRNEMIKEKSESSTSVGDCGSVL